MAHTQAGSRVATSKSTIGDDPEIDYELKTAGPPNVSTTDIQQSIDSENLHFTGIERQGNRRVYFHGREDFTVSFSNSTSNKGVSCTCSNTAPCSHIYWALNQYANAKCHQDGKRRATGVIYPRGKDRSDQRPSIEVDREDVWPLPTLNNAVDASTASAYIHRRLGDKTPEQMEESLFSYNRHMEWHMDQNDRRVGNRILICSDRPIYAAAWTSLEPIIAQACIVDRKLEKRFRAVLTVEKQTAIKIEDIKRQADAVFTTLTDRWVGLADEDERGFKRGLTQCADRVYTVYSQLWADVYSEENRIYRAGTVDTSEPSHAAAEALIFMLKNVVVRTESLRRSPRSLWEEFTQLDYSCEEPNDFWTVVFRTFDFIQATPDVLQDPQVDDLDGIRLRARRNRPRVPIPDILERLNGIVQRSVQQAREARLREQSFREASS